MDKQKRLQVDGMRLRTLLLCTAAHNFTNSLKISNSAEHGWHCWPSYRTSLARAQNFCIANLVPPVCLWRGSDWCGAWSVTANIILSTSKKKLKHSSQQPHHIPAEEKNTLDKLTDFSSHPLLMFQCICNCKYFIWCTKGHIKDVSVHAQSKHKNNTKRKLNRKQTKRKRAIAHKKNTQKQNKIQDISLYIIPSLVSYFHFCL